MTAHVEGFFDPETSTVSYVVYDKLGGECAIVDPVHDYDARAGRLSTVSADRLVAFVRKHELRTRWLLETHVHADHLSASPYLQRQLGGTIGIGQQVVSVQHIFKPLFNLGQDFQLDGGQFGHLFEPDEGFAIGELRAHALHVPGHTAADMAYVVEDTVFVGDTLFMPDVGTARCDFPGGDAGTMYASIQRLLALPGDTRVFVCHDYPPPGRSAAWQTTIENQRLHNIHIKNGVSEQEFVAFRTERDKGLALPALILPSIQVNLRAGHLPETENNGTRYLKIPLDVF